MAGQYLSVLFLCLLSARAFASPEIVVKAPWNTPSGDQIYLKTHDGVRFPLSLQDHLTYVGTLPLTSFTLDRGREGTEAVDNKGVVLPEMNFSANEVMSIANWKDLPALGLIGDIELIPDVVSTELNNKRNISVYLPPGYHRHSRRHYPVLYMHDGQNVFNPKTSTTGIDWRIDDILNSEITSGKIPAVIVVAIDCIPDARHEEYDLSRRGNLYADFLIHTVKPMIDKKYRTFKGRNSTFLMGSSMGAIVSLQLLWKHSDVFSRGVGLSFPATANAGSVSSFIEQNENPLNAVSYYMDRGDYGDDLPYVKADDTFVEMIKKQYFGAHPFVYDIDPFGDHREVDWARRAPEALKWLLNPP